MSLCMIFKCILTALFLVTIITFLVIGFWELIDEIKLYKSNNTNNKNRKEKKND